MRPRWIKNESAAESFECLRVLIPALPFYRILNCCLRGLQEFIEPILDDCVALARCLLETRTIEHLNRPAVVADEAGRLHGLRRQCHRLPIGTQDMRQKFVGVVSNSPSARSCIMSSHRLILSSVVCTVLQATVCWTCDSSVSE